MHSKLKLILNAKHAAEIKLNITWLKYQILSDISMLCDGFNYGYSGSLKDEIQIFSKTTQEQGCKNC